MTFECPLDHFLGYNRNLTELTLECDESRGDGRFDEWPDGAVCYDVNGQSGSVCI